ncbi:MAG: FeoA family protein [Planctomycetota bacterium]|nr:FeoA family protein [Planctomycetota bacterium]
MAVADADCEHVGGETALPGPVPQAVAQAQPPAAPPARDLRPPLALTDMAAGQTGAVCEHCMDPADATLLRAMGLRPNATIRVCRTGEPTIVEVYPSRPGEGSQCARADCRCRLGLAWVLASRVKVRADA